MCVFHIIPVRLTVSYYASPYMPRKLCNVVILVRPKLEYTCTVWSPWQQYLIDNIEKVQWSAAWYICNVYNPTHSVTSLLQNLSWEPLEVHRMKAQLHMFYKIFNNLAEIRYHQYTLPSTITSTGLPSPLQIKLIQLSCRKSPFKYPFIPNTIPTWSKLPSTVIDCNSLDNFKYNLDNYFDSTIIVWSCCTVHLSVYNLRRAKFHSNGK